MKKYWMAVIAFFVLGTGVAALWFTGRGAVHEVSAEEISGWLQNPEQNVFEIGKHSFYVQEAIGSQKIVLRYPSEFSGDFGLDFQMMSLTRSAIVRLLIKTGSDFYETEMHFAEEGNRLRFYKNKMLMLEKEAPRIAPDVFYLFSLVRQGRLFRFGIDGQAFLTAEINSFPATLLMEIQGAPDDTAAVEIMDWRIRS